MRRLLVRLLYFVQHNFRVITMTSAVVCVVSAWSAVVVLEHGMARESGSASGVLGFLQRVAHDGYRVAGTLVLEGPQIRDDEQGYDPSNEQLGRHLLFLARASALVFNLSLAVAIFLAVSKRWQESLERSHFRASSCRTPYAVCFGLGKLNMQVVHDLRSDDEETRRRVGTKRNVIVVESDPTNPWLDEASSLGALVIVGDVTSPEIRKRAGLDAAGDLIIACGDDARNIDLARDVIQAHRTGEIERRAEMKKAPAPYGHLQCRVHVGEQDLSELLAEHDLFECQLDPVDLHTFSSWNNAAFDLLLNRDHGLATAHAPASHEIPWYGIFGFERAGQVIALEIARLAHFPCARRPRMTIHDHGIDDLRRGFLARYPGFAPDDDIDLEEHAARPDPDKDLWSHRGYRASSAWRTPAGDGVEYVCTAEFRGMNSRAESPDDVARLHRLMTSDGDAPVKPALIVCFADERKNVRSALRLQSRLLGIVGADDPLCVPIYVYVPTEEGLGRMLREATRHPRFPIIPFGLASDMAGYDVITHPVREDVARIIHLSYLETLDGDRSVRTDAERRKLAERAWECMTPAEKAQNYTAAAHALVKLACLGYRYRPASPGESAPPLDVRDLERLAPVEHNRWMAERLVLGWRFGPYPEGYDALDEDGKRAARAVMSTRRLRGSLVPWDALSDEEKDKDRSQVNRLQSDLELAGQVIESIPASASSVCGGSSR